MNEALGPGGQNAEKPSEPKFDKATLILLAAALTASTGCTVLMAISDDQPLVATLMRNSAYILAAVGLVVWLVSILAADVSIVDLWWGASFVAQAVSVAALYSLLCATRYLLVWQAAVELLTCLSSAYD